MKKVAVALLVIVLCGSASVLSGAESKTWHLGASSNWQSVGGDEQGRYMLAVSHVKELINDGKRDQAQKALADLKKQFPRIAGPDLDQFIKADLLFAKGKFTDSIPEFNKFMDDYPISPLYDSAMEREFQMGVALLAGYKIPLLKIFRVRGYDEGVKTMEKLADRAGNAPIAQQSLIAVARHYEKRRKFREAYDTWADIGSRWPTGELGKESLLNMARDMHSSYRGPRYDASGLPTAKGYYETFKMRYPEDARAIGVDAIITQITEQMAYKQLSIAKYYERTKSKTAATLYYDLVAADYKGTASGQAAQAKIEAQKQ